LVGTGLVVLDEEVVTGLAALLIFNKSKEKIIKIKRFLVLRGHE
jgi:hypothetical protein